MGWRLWLVFASAITAAVHTSPVSWSKQVTINVDTVRWTHLVHDRFLSFTIRPETIMKTANFSKQLLTMAKGLSPAFIRLGGPETNTMKFTSSIDSNNSSSVTATGEQWLKLNKFMSDAGLDLIVCLNNKHRIRNVWDSGNALELISFSDRHGLNITWQLGYESQRLNWNPTYISGVELGRDVVRLRKILDSFPRYQKSSIIGPDIVALSAPEDVRFIREYLSEAGNALTVVTWHHHFQNENTTENKESTEDVRALAKIMQDLDTRVWSKESLTMRSAKKPIWIAEQSPNGETFSDAMLLIKRLGAAARLGFQVVMRQPSSETLCHQTPVYWASLLYRNLVGRAVLGTKMSSTDQPELQIFSHCTAIREAPMTPVIDAGQTYQPGTVTIFGSNSAEENVRLNLKASFKEEEVHVYVLTTDDNDNQTMTTYMNDKQLVLTAEGELPMMSPEVQHPGRTVAVTVPARSIFFIVLPTLRALTCMQYSGTGAVNQRIALPQRTKVTSKITQTGIESEADKLSSEKDGNSKNSSKTNGDRNRLLERSDIPTRDSILTPKHLRTSGQRKTRNKIDEALNKINEDYIKYITFSDNAWLSKFPETNNSQEITDEMMKRFEDSMQEAENLERTEYSQAALESIRSLNITERRKLYLALTQAIIGKRRSSNNSINDNKDNTDYSGSTNVLSSNKNNHNKVTTGNSLVNMTEDIARVKRFVEAKTVTDINSQFEPAHSNEKPKPDITSESGQAFLNKNSKSASSMLNIESQVQENKNTVGTVKTANGRNNADDDYIEEVKMLMESVLNEDSADNSKQITPRELRLFPTDMEKRNDLLFSDNIGSVQELLEAELAPLKQANRNGSSLEEEKSTFNITPVICKTDRRNNDRKVVGNMRRELEQYNRALISKGMRKDLMAQDHLQKTNTDKENASRSMHVSTEVSPWPFSLNNNNEDTVPEEVVNTIIKQNNNLRSKREESIKNNITNLLALKLLSNETSEEKNVDLYLYLKDLAEEGERILKSLYKEQEEVDGNGDKIKIPIKESDNFKSNSSSTLILPTFLDPELSESPAGNKGTNKRDTSVMTVTEFDNDKGEHVKNESIKSFQSENTTAENKIKLNLTENTQAEIQLGGKSEQEKLIEALTSSANIQSRENEQEYLSLIPFYFNNTNDHNLHILNSTMIKPDNTEILDKVMKVLNDGIRSEESKDKSDTSIYELSTRHEMHYSNEDSEEQHSQSAEESDSQELKQSETDKTTTTRTIYNEDNHAINEHETSLMSMITADKVRNNSNNNEFVNKGNSGSEKLGVIMKISDKTAKRMIGKRDETDNMEENGSNQQNNGNPINLDPLKHSTYVGADDYSTDKAIRKRDDNSMMQEKHIAVNSDTDIVLNSAMNTLQREDDQQDGLHTASTNNNDINNINEKTQLTNEMSLQSNNLSSNVHNTSANSISTTATASENKTINNNDPNSLLQTQVVSTTEGNEPATINRIRPPILSNKVPKLDAAFLFQQHRNQLEAYKKRLAETRQRLLNRAGINNNNNENKRYLLIKQKREVDNIEDTDYTLEHLSKFISLEGEDYNEDPSKITDKRRRSFQRLANSNDITNTGYIDLLEGGDDKTSRNQMLDESDRSADVHYTRNDGNDNLPVFRLIRLLTNGQQKIEKKQQDRCTCQEKRQQLLIPIDSVTPVVSDIVGAEDNKVYTVIPAVINGRRLLHSISNQQSKHGDHYFLTQKGKIKETKTEGSDSIVHGDQITDSYKNIHMADVNNKRSDSRKKRKVFPLLLIDSDNNIKNYNDNKNIRLKRSLTPIHSIVDTNKGSTQNKITLHPFPMQPQSVRYSRLDDIKMRAAKLLHGRHSIKSNKLLQESKIQKRSVDGLQLNMKNSIKPPLSNDISIESTSLSESEEVEDCLFDSILHKTFLKTLTEKKNNESSLSRLYKLASEYQKTKPKDDSIETGAILKKKRFRNGPLHESKPVRRNSIFFSKNKNRTDIDNTIIQEERTANLPAKKNQLSDIAVSNTTRVNVINNTDLIKYLFDKIDTIFGFLNMFTGG